VYLDDVWGAVAKCDGRDGTEYPINAINFYVGVDINVLSISPLMYANM